MELTSLTNMQEKRLERLSDLEIKLQTIQMQGKSELSKKDAAFKRETDALRLQLVRLNQIYHSFYALVFGVFILPLRRCVSISWKRRLAS